MTMESEKKRSMFFWKKSHSHSNLKASQGTEATVPSPTEGGDLAFQPDAGSGEFVERDVNLSSLFMPFIKNYVSNLSHNKSPTKLPYPPAFYYPASSLQHQMNLQMCNIDLLLGANLLNTPLERFIAVLKYSLSTCNVTKFPYKPIIAFVGETAQSTVTTSNGQSLDTTFYTAEQVEKEPSTSAFFISNPTRGVVHSGYVTLSPKFKQGHVQAQFIGQRQTKLTGPSGAWNETYIGDIPDVMIRLLRMHTELGGELNLNCPETGISATIQFKDKPIFGGVKNGVSGKITQNGRELYTIEGTWDDVTYLVDCNTKQRFELFNRTITPKLKIETLPLEQQLPTSGERNWKPLLDCLNRQDFEGAKAAKATIDAEHHERNVAFETNPFVASFFQRAAAGGWEIKDPNLVVSNKGGLASM